MCMGRRDASGTRNLAPSVKDYATSQDFCGSGLSTVEYGEPAMNTINRPNHGPNHRARVSEEEVRS